MILRPPSSTCFPSRTLFRSWPKVGSTDWARGVEHSPVVRRSARGRVRVRDEGKHLCVTHTLFLSRLANGSAVTVESRLNRLGARRRPLSSGPPLCQGPG